jgi:pyruvate dehydrogenase E2 component (dihydrolipoamide acetyltransferase)
MKNRIQPITMPKWGIEMQEGTINAWHCAVGAAISKGDPLLDVETEKIVNSVESPVDGVLRRVIVDAGETRPVGALLAVYADADVADAEIDEFVASFRAADASFEPESATAPAAAVAPATAPAAEGESKVSPIARRVAERLGVDVSKVQGTGRHGRVSKEDVEAYAAAHGLMPAAGGQPAAPAAVDNTPTREKMTSMRLTIARRLTESKQSIPHYRLSVDVDCAWLTKRRAELAAGGTKVSLNDLLLRALALTLVEHRDVNAQFAGDEVLRFPHADICVAVSTEGGLTTPILRAADTKDAAKIAAEVADLAERARSARLTREEITGGTFTLSNLGMFGVDRFDAIINPPQVAILAVGAAADRAVVRDGALAVARVMTLALSCDHRVVDGAVGGRFLAALKQRLETGEF